MEAIGLAVGLVGLFSTCLEAVQRIDSYKTAGRDSRLLRAQLNATMHLFERWGDGVGISKGKLSDDHHPDLDDPNTFAVVKGLLTSFEEFSTATTYDATSPKAIQRTPSILWPDPSAPSAPKTPRWQKTAWALRGKLKQTNHVQALATLVSELYSVVSPGTVTAASKSQKPLSRTTSFKYPHATALGSDQDSGLVGQPYAADVRDVLLKLQQELKAETLRDLRTWLGSPPPNDLYSDSKDKRLQETCEWMLHREAFLNWQAPSESDKLLWIKGPAGFGKTVLCARLVQEVEKTTERLMAYFFLSSKFEGREDPFSAVRSWLTMLISRSSTALDIISRRHLSQYDQVASQETILRLFHDVIVEIPGCTFVLDGLDECTGMNSTDTKSVSHFLEELRKAVSNTGTRLLISSRGDPVIQQGLSLFPGYTEYTIQSADVGPDLMIYSSEVVKAKLPNKDEPTKEFIAQKIRDRCQGQFQWIKLQEGALRKGRSRKQLEKEIDETPSGLDSLYDREWNRIMSMGATDKARALLLLRWAAFSMRPLTVYEITEAVLMTEDCEEFPVDEMPDTIDEDYVDSMILDLCGSLIEVRHSSSNETEQKQNREHGKDDEDVEITDLIQQDLGRLDAGLQEVHLTHFSVKEYLLLRSFLNDGNLLSNERIRISNERLENMALTKYCIRYFSLPGAWDNWQMGAAKPTMRLLTYAAQFWLPHYDVAETLDSELQDAVNALFDGRNQSFYPWRTWWESNYLTHVEGLEGGHLTASPFELAIGLGLKDVVMYLIYERKYGVNDRSKYNLSPLHYAGLSDNKGIAELLLENGAELDTMNDEGETPLFFAIDSGNSIVTELLIAKGANILQANNLGLTPLHLASQLGDLKTVKTLLDKGADIAALTNEGMTPLIFASVRGHSQVVSLLLDEGADITTSMEDGFTPLILASVGGNSQVVSVLLEKGADWRHRNKDGYTPLMFACGFGHSEVVRLLLAKGADLYQADQDGYTPLLLASLDGHSEVVRLLLEQGADLYQADQDGYTPLLLASSDGHSEVVRLLLEQGADWRDKDQEGHTTLSLACMNGHPQVVKLLLEKGADWRHVDGNGWTPVFLAAWNNHNDVVDMLLDEGAGFSASRDANKGFYLLCVAAGEGSLELAKLAIDKGASVEEKWVGPPETTPLCLASSSGHLEIVKLLLEKGADVNAVSGDLVTALHGASIMGHYDTVKLLVEQGAGMSVRTEDVGYTPLIGALDERHLEVFNLLLESGSPATSATNALWTPLHVAAIYGDSQVIKPLLDKGADIAAKDKNDDEPIHFAAQRGHLEFVKRLLQEGANPAAKDLFGRSALSYAADFGHESLVDLLISEDHSHLAETDVWSRTLLHYACKGGRLQIVKSMLGLLQETPAIIDGADHWCSTPLSIAVRKGHTSVVKLLLDTNAVDIDSTDKFGRSIVWWATEHGHGEILRLLTEHDQNRDLETEDGDDKEQQLCRSCDICCLNILSGDYYACGSCHGDSFDICPKCFTLGGHCFDKSHNLVTQMVQE